MLQLILAAVEPELADAWQRFCGDLDFVRIYRGSIFDVNADAYVSPPTPSASWTAASTSPTP